jgi:hypothetical protein
MDPAEQHERRFEQGRASWLRRHRAWGLVLFAVASTGCAFWRSAPQRQVVWPDENSAVLVGAPMEAGAALAAAAAVREMVEHNDSERLFQGCSSPEQGLDVAVFKQPGSDLYFVVLHQRFDRCGGPVGRVLDWSYAYAVTAQGEVVAEAPPEAAPPDEAPIQPPSNKAVPPASEAPAASEPTPGSVPGAPLPAPTPPVP